VIITRTPLRISLGGGGTDLPAYYRSEGSGFLVAAAISKYVYIAVNQNFDDDILLKYSQVERVLAADDVAHPLLREALLMTGVGSGIEVSAMADIPAGTGLGSSGAFTVGVLRALWAYRREEVSNDELARQACVIEIDRLKDPIGKQDQYISAVGGLQAFEFHADERVDVIPLRVSDLTHDRLEENLLLFFTGLRRSAAEVLALDQREADRVADLRSSLNEARRIGLEARAALESDDLEGFADTLTAQWKVKLGRQPSPVHRQVDAWIQMGLGSGAVGGKLIGAGEGGFLLFYAEQKAELRARMADLGLPEVRFGIDYGGSTTIARG